MGFNLAFKGLMYGGRLLKILMPI